MSNPRVHHAARRGTAEGKPMMPVPNAKKAAKDAKQRSAAADGTAPEPDPSGVGADAGFTQRCPGCQAPWRIRHRSQIGKHLRCPQCKERFVVAAPFDDPPGPGTAFSWSS